jgi:hypothetical protein
MKDRPGWVRAQAGAQKAVAELVMVSTPDGATVTPSLITPQGQENGFRPTGVMEKVSRLLEGQDGVIDQREVKIHVHGRGTVVVDALRILAAEGFIDVANGPRRTLLYRSLRPFREPVYEEPIRPEEWPDDQEESA